MNSKYFTINLIFCLLAPFAKSQEIYIRLSGRNLEDGDLVWGPPDAFVEVSYGMGPNDLTFVGRTSTLETYDPDWTEIFRFHYVQQLDQRLRFEIVEEDAFFNDHWGRVEIPLKEIKDVEAGGVLERRFEKGRLLIKKLAADG